MQTEDIKKILVVGGGMMGRNIAFVFTANPAYAVSVYDMHDMDLHGGIRKNTEELVKMGVLSAEEVQARLLRISFTTDIDSPLVSGADLVVEAVFENMDVKRETFAKLEKRCRPDAVFCTNTSVLSPTEISRDLTYRSRFCGTHFWNPGHLIPLVEVVRSDATSDETAETVMTVLAGVGKKPVLCKKDVPGFIANRMQHALWREAISIVENGIADAETVDTAVKNSFGLRLPQLGPLENADMVGMELTHSIHNYILPYLEDTHLPSPLLESLINEGKLGFRTGEGFREWTSEEIEKTNTDLNAYLIWALYKK